MKNETSVTTSVFMALMSRVYHLFVMYSTTQKIELIYYYSNRFPSIRQFLNDKESNPRCGTYFFMYYLENFIYSL